MWDSDTCWDFVSSSSSRSGKDFHGIAYVCRSGDQSTEVHTYKIR